VRFDIDDQFTAAYDYTDEHGGLLFQVCRKPDKKFPARKPDGAGGWAWKLGDVVSAGAIIPH
jgi:hypothetical protein